jgi:beta-glucanase (GH16 family)
MKKFGIFISVAYLLLSSACQSTDDDKHTPILPTNLETQIIVSDDGSGKVQVKAIADNTNFYIIRFGNNISAIRSVNGEASYTYTESGNYTIRIQAHATETQYISKEESITVTLIQTGGELVIPTEGNTSPSTYEGMSLVWEEEFEGTELNTSNWTYETGRGDNGWGNEELQYYRKENTAVQDGYLIITAKKENLSGANYTSSRIKTQGKKSFQYGRIDIRAALPKGQGIWPALWMLGENFTTVGWPKCGEIDIMEMVGGNGKENTVHGTVHWYHESNVNENDRIVNYSKGKTLASGTYSDKFYVYSIVWTETSIKWLIDDIQFNEIDITPNDLSEFRAPYFFIINCAVGGRWPGSPNNTTSFPQYFIVDYIRVFQNN